MSAVRPVLLRCDRGLCTAEYLTSGLGPGGITEARRVAKTRAGWITVPGPGLHGGKRDYCPDHHRDN